MVFNLRYKMKSLKQITGKNHYAIVLAKEFCVLLQHRFLQLINSGQVQLLIDYNNALYKPREIIRLKK